MKGFQMIIESINIQDIEIIQVKGVYQKEKLNEVQLHHTIPQIGPIVENESEEDLHHLMKMLLPKMTKVSRRC